MIPTTTASRQRDVKRSGVEAKSPEPIQFRVDSYKSLGYDLTWTVVAIPAVPARAGPADPAWCTARNADTGPDAPYLLCVDLAGEFPLTRLYSIYLPGRVTPGTTAKARRGNALRIYSDYEDASRVETTYPYLLPNLELVVVTRAASGHTTTITPTGVRGLTLGRAYGGAGVEDKEVNLGESSGGGAASGASTLRLLPRLPSPITLTVTDRLPNPASPGGTPVDVRSVPTELQVLPHYFGALRISFAGLWSPSETTYTLITEPTGGYQLEVARRKGEVVDPELTLGFSTYLGRPAHYRLPDPKQGFRYGLGKPFRPGLYLGVGVLAPGDAAAVTTLRTVYAGLDFELSPHAAIGLTGFVRRAKFPIAPYEEGSTLDGSTGTWWVERPVGGVALLVSITPYYFSRFAPTAAMSR